MLCPRLSALLVSPFLRLRPTSLSLFPEHSLGYRKQFQFEKFKYPGRIGGRGEERRVRSREAEKGDGTERERPPENGGQGIARKRETERKREKERVCA